MRKIKTILSCIIVISMLCIMIPASAAVGTVAFNTANTTVKVGDTFTVTVDITIDEAGKAFKGGALTVSSDDTLATLKSYERGTLTASYSTGSSSLTTKKANFTASATDTWADENGTYAVLTFEAIKAGSFTVSASQCKLQFGNPGTTATNVTTATPITITIEDVAATKYDVTYNTDGASSTTPTQDAVEAGTKITLAAAPTKDGYTFKGWNDGTSTYAAGAEYEVNAAVTFTAQWEKIPVPPVFSGTSDRTNVTGKDGKEYSNIFVGNYSITPNDKTWTGCKFYPDTVGFDGTKGDLTFKSGFSFEGAGTITFKTAIVGVPEGVGIIIEPVYAD